jgi:hypothetical protein
MSSLDFELDGADLALERSLAATYDACMVQREKCSFIRQSLDLAERAWLEATARLKELEELRDALQAELEIIETQAALPAPRRRTANAA